MWLAALTAIVVAHATPELTHLRRDPLTVRVSVDGVVARHGVVADEVEKQFVIALRDGGIRVRDPDPSADEAPGGSITVSVDGFEEPGATPSGKVAFTIRVTVRQAVLLPDRMPAYADIWSLSALGLARPDALPATVGEGLEPIIQRLGDDLGAGHGDEAVPREPAATPDANVLTL